MDKRHNDCAREDVTEEENRVNVCDRSDAYERKQKVRRGTPR